jgi:hypothetical protein
LKVRSVIWSMGGAMDFLTGHLYMTSHDV